MGAVPLYFGRREVPAELTVVDHHGTLGKALQGYLAHKKTPTPLGICLV